MDKPILKIAELPNVKVALFKALLTFYGSIAMLFLSITYFSFGNYIRGVIYSVAFVGMALMCFSFSQQYRMFKFLRLFRGNINDKKN